MKLFPVRHWPVKRRKAANSPDQEHRAAWQNLILCTVGLVVGFVYLLQHNSAGWFFLLGFTFLLIMQATPADQDHS